MAKHTIAKQPSGQFQITFTIPNEDIQAQYKKSLAEVAKNVEVPGFRKGKAPLDKVESQVNQSRVYENVIETLLPEIYAKAIEAEKLKPIISPQVRLVSAQPDQDWQIEATACETPSVDLKDSLKTLKGLLKSSEIWTPEKGKTEEEKPTEPTEEQKLDKIIRHLLEKAEVEIPEVLATQEADRELSRLVEHIQKLGLSLDQYLSSTGKTHETLRQEYADRATNELKAEFIIGKVANEEKIEVAQDEIQQIIDNTTDDQLKKALLENPQARVQVQISILKRKTFDHLLKIAS